VYSNFSDKLKVFSQLFISLIPAKTDCVVVSLHNIQQDDYSWLNKVLHFIAQHYEFIEPNSNIQKFTPYNDTIKVLLSFDDGFRSNYYVAKNILKPLNVHALFFITSNFIGLRAEDAFRFAQKYFYPSRDIENNNEYDAMDLEEICWLQEQGHVIGAHTYDHPKLSQLSENEQRRQIINSANELEDMICRPVRSFAYPFGSVTAVDENSVMIAKGRFDNAYSNIRGMANESVNNHFIFRQNIVPGMPLWLVRAAIEGRLDWRYRNVRHAAQVRFRTPNSNR
jgi:peptidoglycan/xylan/chitin deacetylase (PgdA/CDA1 family)